MKARLRHATDATLALSTLALLAVLGVARPALPHINSLTGPLSTRAIKDIALCLAWLIALCILLVLLLRATHRLIRRPASRDKRILPGVLPGPPSPRRPTPLSEQFQPPIGLTLRPRSSLPEASPLREPAVATTTPTAVAVDDTPRDREPPTRPEPAVSISLLGPLRIEGTNRPPKRTKTREMIAYLVLHPNGASRDEISEAIWPGGDPQKTKPRLWEAASDARAALGDVWIAENERYRLDRAQLKIDVDELDQLLGKDESDLQALDAALALWRGEPLEGADYIWADGEIHRLHATLIGLLERAGNLRLQRGDARGALELAERAIALDQFHEPSWRLALQADHALGLRESITRRYEALTAALDHELGLQPSRETRATYRQLLTQT